LKRSLLVVFYHQTWNFSQVLLAKKIAICCLKSSDSSSLVLLMAVLSKTPEHAYATVAIRNPEQHMRKASHCGSKQQ